MNDEFDNEKFAKEFKKTLKLINDCKRESKNFYFVYQICDQNPGYYDFAIYDQESNLKIREQNFHFKDEALMFLDKLKEERKT